MPDRKILLRRRSREFIPRADQLAVIATIDAIADRAAKFCRDTAVELDREVGNGAARIEAVGRDDGAGGTRRNTGAAGAAVRGAGFVRRQFEIDIDLTEK